MNYWYWIRIIQLYSFLQLRRVRAQFDMRKPEMAQQVQQIVHKCYKINNLTKQDCKNACITARHDLIW